MANTGDLYRDALIAEIRSWDIDGLEIYKEPWVGERFVGKKRYVDIVLMHERSAFGIETKAQYGSGSADQKLFYALEDCENAPIPMVIAFTGEYIGPDIKSRLVLSGLGIEVGTIYDPHIDEVTITDASVLKQRALMALGLDWLVDQSDCEV